MPNDTPIAEDPDRPVQRDLLVLLIQLAWSDHDLAPAEVDYIRDLARTLQFSPDEMHDVDCWLKGSMPLPAPNLARLAAHRAVVMKTAANIITADGVVVHDETEMLQQLAAMLPKTAP